VCSGRVRSRGAKAAGLWFRSFLCLVALALGCSGTTDPEQDNLEPGWRWDGLRGLSVRSLIIVEPYLYAGTNDGVFRRHLHQSSRWTSVGLTGRSVRALLYVPQRGLLAAAEITSKDSASLFLSNIEGTSWRRWQGGFGGVQSGDFPGSREVRSLAMLRDEALLAGGHAGVVARSSDQGASWNVVWGTWTAGALGMHTIQVGADHVVWIGGELGYFQPILIRSLDDGLNWQSISIHHPGSTGGDNAIYAIAIDPVDPRIVLLGMEWQIRRTSDGGTTWATVRGWEDPRYFYGIEFSRIHAGRVYATGSENTLEKQDLGVLVSNDGGNSWTEVKGPPELSRGGLSMVLAELGGREVVYIGSGNGVYRHLDD